MKDPRLVATARRTLLRRGRALVRSGTSRAQSSDVFDALTREEQAELAQIHHALERIERGIFGRCESCSTEIADERLSVLPWSPRCARCDEDELTLSTAEQLSA